MSPTADSFFSKNGCAVSVTMWGDHLAQLMQKMFRRALSDTPPPPSHPPTPTGGGWGWQGARKLGLQASSQIDSLWAEPILALKTADGGVVTAISLPTPGFVADMCGSTGGEG